MNFSIRGSSAWWSRTHMLRVTALDIQVSLRNPTAILEDSMTSVKMLYIQVKIKFDSQSTVVVFSKLWQFSYLITEFSEISILNVLQIICVDIFLHTFINDFSFVFSNINDINFLTKWHYWHFINEWWCKAILWDHKSGFNFHKWILIRPYKPRYYHKISLPLVLKALSHLADLARRSNTGAQIFRFSGLGTRTAAQRYHIVRTSATNLGKAGDGRNFWTCSKFSAVALPEWATGLQWQYSGMASLMSEEHQ